MRLMPARSLVALSGRLRLPAVVSHAGLVVVPFMVLIWLPLAARLAGLGEPDPTREQRPLAKSPDLPLMPWQAKPAEPRLDAKFFPVEFEAHIADHFPWRQNVSGTLNGVEAYHLGHSPVASVVPGKDRWLYLDGGGSFDQYRRTVPFPADRLAEWDEFLRGFQAWLGDRGISLMFVLCPNKETIYPEFVPDRFTVLADRPHPVDSFADMVARTPVEFVDLREPLRRAKHTEQVYYRQDTHWNDRGVFVGYSEVASRLAERFPAVRPRPRSETVATLEPNPLHDLARMLCVDDCDPDLVLTPTPDRPFRGRQLSRQDAADSDTANVWTVDDPSLPRAAVYHDSFFWRFDLWLKDHFSESSWVAWEPDPRPTPILSVRPDIVIYEIVERSLNQPPPSLTHLHEADYLDCPTPQLRLGPADLTRIVPANGGPFTLPPVDAGPAERIVIRIEVEGDVLSDAKVVLTAAGRRHTRRLSTKRHSLYVSLPAADATDGITIDPGTAGDQVTIHAVEARTR